MGRVVAIDYGTKRSGIAVTDEDQRIAFPLQTEPTHKLLAFLKEYAGKEQVDRFVIGEPKKLDSGPTHATKYVEDFIRKLGKEFPAIPIDRIDERFTSSLAQDAIRESGLKRSARKEKEIVDVTSATIILQSWMEQQENLNK